MAEATKYLVALGELLRKLLLPPQLLPVLLCPNGLGELVGLVG